MDTNPMAGMNASEKTKYLGIKMYSEKELAQRQREAEDRRSKGFVFCVERLFEMKDDIRVGKHLSEDQLSVYMKPLVNDFYKYALDNDLSQNDMESVGDAFISCAFFLGRGKNEANGEVKRFVFAMTGENDVENVPLTKLLKIAEVAKENFPQNYGEEFDEEVADQVVTDVPTAETPTEPTPEA